MIGDLRALLWQAFAPCFEIENELKIRMKIGSVFANVYQEIPRFLPSLEKSLKTQI